MRRDIFQAIAENFNTTRQAISKHLRILTECDLVKQNRKNERDRQMVEPIQKNLGNPV